MVFKVGKEIYLLLAGGSSEGSVLGCLPIAVLYHSSMAYLSTHALAVCRNTGRSCLYCLDISAIRPSSGLASASSNCMEVSTTQGEEEPPHSTVMLSKPHEKAITTCLKRYCALVSKTPAVVLLAHRGKSYPGHRYLGGRFW